jgi:cell division protease FtsH
VARDILSEHKEHLETISELLLKRETIEADEFVALLDGKTEIEVWGEEAEELPPGPERPEIPGTVTRDREAAKRQFPRPGLAAELRAHPEKPDSA